MIFSHKTALHLLRIWSESHALPLRAFHDLGVRDVGHLPSSNLKGTSSLSGAADSEAAVRAIIDGTTKPSLRALLEKLWKSASTAEPLHVLVQPDRGRHSTKRVTFHQTGIALPARSLLEIAPGIAVCSPELVFVQMAESLSLGELIALGYELCGCYPVSADQGSPRVRSQLTTPARLAAFVNRANRMNGLRKARVAARHIHAKSASVRETEMGALLQTPMKWGGLGLPEARANEPVSLSPRAAQIACGTRVVCDLLWEDPPIAVEYDGREYHEGSPNQVRDSRRRDAMTADGFHVVTVTSPQLDGTAEFFEIADSIARKMGRKPRKRDADFAVRHRELRRELRKYHRENFPLPPKSEEAS